MLEVMGCFITDGGSVPQDILDIILECLLPKMQTMNPSAYELAKELLRRTSDVTEQSLLLVRILGELKFENLQNVSCCNLLGLKIFTHLLLRKK